MSFSDRAQCRARCRIRWLFLAVVVVFFAQFVGGTLWSEPVPGLFAPGFKSDGSNKKTGRRTPPAPRLGVRFQDGDEEIYRLEDLVGGAYYKLKRVWARSFRLALERDEVETTSELVDWLVARISDSHSERSLMELRWVYEGRDEADATRSFWLSEPDSD